MDTGAINLFSPLPEPVTKAPERADASPKSSAGATFGSVLAARAPVKDAAPDAHREDAKAVAASADDGVTLDEAPESSEGHTLTPSAPLKSAVAMVKVKGPASVSAVPTVAADTEDAWTDFLTDMDEQVGVTAADVLGAFESLSEEDLSKPAEETTDQMVAAMGLSGAAAQIAKQLLTRLINRTEKPAEGVVADSAPINARLTGTDSRFSPEPVAMKMSLEKGASKSTSREPSIEGKGLAEIARAGDVDAAAVGEEIKSSAPGAVDSMPAASTEKSLAKGQVPSNGNEPADRALNALVEKMQALPENARPNADRLVRDIIARGRPDAAPNPVPADAAPAIEGELDSVDDMKMAPKLMAQVASERLTRDLSSDSNSSESDDREPDAETDSFRDQTLDQRPLAGQAPRTDFTRALNANIKDSAPVAPNVAPELVENARLMVRNGGGEMKVTVNSALGEIAMNVSVKDGKVSVEMLAETDEAKQVLKHQLDDLKTQLTAHALQIDKLNVDTQTNLGQRSDQRQSAEQQRPPGWEQLDQRGSGQNPQQRRQANYDSPERAYDTGVVKRGGNSAAPARPGQSRRLNVVA